MIPTYDWVPAVAGGKSTARCLDIGGARAHVSEAGLWMWSWGPHAGPGGATPEAAQSAFEKRYENYTAATAAPEGK